MSFAFFNWFWSTWFLNFDLDCDSDEETDKLLEESYENEGEYDDVKVLLSQCFFSTRGP